MGATSGNCAPHEIVDNDASTCGDGGSSNDGGDGSNNDGGSNDGGDSSKLKLELPRSWPLRTAWLKIQEPSSS